MDRQPIVIWGTGNVARNFFYKNCYKYDTKYFIDNYAPKYRMKNLKVYFPQEVNLRKYKIVIAIEDWHNVAEQLVKSGLLLFKNYLPYNLLEKNEVPILDILMELKNQEDREEAICEYQHGRKIALINGNCQTSRIKCYLKQNQNFNNEYVFLDIPPLYELKQNELDLLMQNSYILKEINLFISQNISLNNTFDYRLSNEYLIGLMSDDVKYIRIPNLFFDIYFPQGGKEQDASKEEFVREMFPYNDAVIDELIKRKGFGGEYSADEIIQIINLEGLFSPAFLKGFVKYRMEQLKERETYCDVKMMDYIENNYCREQLFYSRNHPINKVIKEESVRILQYINPKWDMSIEHEETIPALSVNQEFMYPSVVNGLNLTFLKDGIQTLFLNVNIL
jgi:hypothetical protein